MFSGAVQDRTRRWMKRWIVGEISPRRFLGSALFLYGSLALFAFLGADWLIYRPYPTAYVDDAATIGLTTASGARISAVFSAAPGARVAVLYSHGNAEDSDDIGYLVEEIRGLGLDVLAYDYEGYGTSEGEPSERRLYEDIDAAYRYLTEVRGVPPERVILYGRSLGSGPAGGFGEPRPGGRPGPRERVHLGLPRGHARAPPALGLVRQPRQDVPRALPGAGAPRDGRSGRSRARRGSSSSTRPPDRSSPSGSRARGTAT